MKKKKIREVEYIECDGCQYVINEAERVITLNLYDGWHDLEFFFHSITHKTHHDCFRYWAHDPRVMERALKERNMSQEQRDNFLSKMLYREKV